jgi:hypothetical protein
MSDMMVSVVRLVCPAEDTKHSAISTWSCCHLKVARVMKNICTLYIGIAVGKPWHLRCNWAMTEMCIVNHLLLAVWN